jgi:ankyrin repeat protein
MQKLLSFYWIKEKLDLQLTNGATALILASYKGYTKVVRLLLDKRANPNLKSNEGKTALDYAANSEIKNLLTKYLRR